jgi:hypothetical protein
MPSVRKAAPREPVPLKDTVLPLESVKLFWPALGLDWKPGKRLRRLRKSRPAMGSSGTIASSMLRRIWPVVTSMICAFSSTVTDVDIAET